MTSYFLVDDLSADIFIFLMQFTYCAEVVADWEIFDLLQT